MHGARGRDPPAARCVSRPLATYTWDSEDRLVRVELPGTVAEYVYDPLGRRIQKTVNGEITKYLYDGEDIVAELDAANNVVTSFVHGPGIDEPLAMVRDGRTYTYHRDALGSITHITDDAGLVVQRYAYDAYGNVTAELDPDFIQPYGFTGRERDRETGLLYYRARYYDPKLGRFISEDPIGFLGGANFYRYVQNNPVTWVDPFGLHTLTFDGRGVTFRGDAGEFLGYVPATSGRDGVTDPSLPWKGPIPPGEYTLDPSEITPGNWRRDLTGDWGEWRAPLHPVDPSQVPPGRDPKSFFLHGGKRPGSAGCIDVGERDRHLFPPLIGHGGPIRVIVKYPR